MTKVELDDPSEPTSDELSTASPTVGSLLMSVAFWTALLTSALMYAIVSLSPKLADWINVRQQYASNAARLMQLEDDADYLERVSAALKSDPEFAQRLVRAAQSPSAEDSEFVPVAQNLWFGESAHPVPEAPQMIRPAIANLVFHLAGHQRHRTCLLVSAAGLTLLAFTLLNDAGAGIVMCALSTVAAGIRAAVCRYRTADPGKPESVEYGE